MHLLAGILVVVDRLGNLPVEESCLGEIGSLVAGLREEGTGDRRVGGRACRWGVLGEHRWDRGREGEACRGRQELLGMVSFCFYRWMDCWERTYVGSCPEEGRRAWGMAEAELLQQQYISMGSASPRGP